MEYIMLFIGFSIGNLIFEFIKRQNKEVFLNKETIFASFAKAFIATFIFVLFKGSLR